MSSAFITLTTSPGFATKGDHMDQLERLGTRLVRHVTDDAALREAAHAARYLVAGLVPVTEDLLEAAPNLKAVLKHGVGLDSIDMAACSARNIAVLSTPGANARAVAEMALGAMFGISRNIVSGHLFVTSGGWNRQVGRELGDATLGIIGFGRIGQELAQMARALGMRVIAHDPWAAKEIADALGVELAMFDQVIRTCDFLSVHVAGGPQTKDLIGDAELAAMKPGAAVLNFARGDIVNIDALQEHLSSGRLSGAALDAFSQEPPDTSHPIFANPKVIFSPHSGADTVESLLRMGQMVIDDIATLESGKIPARTVNAKYLEI